MGAWALPLFSNIKDKSYAILPTCKSNTVCENAILIFFHKTERMYQLFYLFINFFIYALVQPIISAEAFHPTSIYSGYSL